MKTNKLTLVAAATLLLTFNSNYSTAYAQGNLAPPGAPAPTMKSLDQIEARTPIAFAPFTITEPGSYYLTTNITANAASSNAISIMADNVTLDLNGFTISSTANPASGFAICLNSNQANITIKNGLISSGVTVVAGNYQGSGFLWGVAHLGSPARNVRVSGLTVTGCQYGGIYIDRKNTVIQSCVVDTAGDTGIFASSVFDSTAVNCGNNGIYADWAYNCAGTAIANGNGIYANNAYNCNGTTSTGTGLYAVNVAANCSGGATSSAGSTIGVSANTANNCLGYIPGGSAAIRAGIANDCYGQCDGSGVGVWATYAAKTCYGTSGSGDGIHATIAENCQAYGSQYGLVATSAINCYGSAVSHDAVRTTIAIGCFGQSAASLGSGIESGISAFSDGVNSGAGNGIDGIIANSCFTTPDNGAVDHKYNMP
jgi:hypothetical protein